MMLAEAGVRTVEELEALGAVKAYARVKALGRRGASLNLLYSMSAGLEDRGWQEVTAEEKDALKREFSLLWCS